MTTERRALADGLRPAAADRLAEEQFVYNRPRPAAPDPAPPPPARVNLHTRVRQDYAVALKRATLERQIRGETPNTVQDIVEEALGPWLAAHGYLPGRQT